MNEFAGSVWWLLVTLGILITFHEYGHFWVARRCGVKVLRFSIGFGKALWSRYDRHGTEFVIAAIPLGGYVKMLDEREGEVSPAELGAAYNRKPVLQRMAIAAAGPAANFLFAIAAFWLMFVIGKPDFQPTINQPGTASLAATAGFQADDQLLAINDQPVETWTKAIIKLSEAALARSDAHVTVRQTNGNEVSRQLSFSQLPAHLPDDQLFSRIGLSLKPRDVPPVIDRVESKLPADAAGIVPGDRITAVNGHPVQTFRELETTLKNETAIDPHLTLSVKRGDQQLTVALTAQNQPDKDNKPRWIIGVGNRADLHNALLQYGPLAAIPAAFMETWDTTLSSLNMLKLMVMGQTGLNNLSGTISIARFANDSAHLGIAWFLSFLGLVSLSLAIMNLLPIPVLDGGHLLYYFIELIKGGPVSERVQIAGQYIGVTLLVTLMSVALYNDILRLFS